MNIISFVYGIFSSIFLVFLGILQKFHLSNYEFDAQIAMDVFKRMLNSIIEVSLDNDNDNDVVIQRPENNRKIKIGLLTNEIPPIVYGGVATWIVNFINMFKDNEYFEVYPIFLAHLDNLPEECFQSHS